MQLQLRSPFHPADSREARAPWPVVFFVMMVSGFVAYEVCTEWSAAAAVFKWVPNQLASASGISGSDGWFKGVWTLFVFPLLLWLVLGGVTMATGTAKSLGEAWQRLALPVVVVVAAGHMAKGLAKVASWGGYLPGAFSDPGGQATALAITAGELEFPKAILAKAWIGGIGLVLIAIATLFALREARLVKTTSSRRLVVPIVGISIAYAAVVAGWMR